VWTLTSEVTEKVRVLSGILLRRILVESAAGASWASSGRAVHEELRGALEEGFKREGSARMRRVMSHAIAQVAVWSFAEPLPEEVTGCPPMPMEGWPSVIPLALEAAGSDDAGTQAAGFHLLGALCECLGERVMDFGDDIAAALAVGLGSSRSLDVVRFSVSACSNFCVHIVEKEKRELLADAIPMMVAGLRALLEHGHYDAASAVADVRMLAQNRPDMFRACAVEVAQLASDASLSEDVDEGSRRAVLELVVTLLESAPGAARQEPRLVQVVVQALLQLLCLVLEDDDDAWCERDFNVDGDSSGDDDTFSLSMTAEGSLLRVAAAVGASVALPAVLEHVPALLGSAAWTERRAALVALAMLCEAVGDRAGAIRPDDRASMLDAALERATREREAHPRVRHAALTCLGSMGQAFDEAKGVHFQDEAAARVLPVLAHAAHAEESGNPARVCAQAASAISVFCAPQRADPEHVEPAASALLGALATLLHAGAALPGVVSIALVATAAVAKSAPAVFEAMYGDFMGAVSDLLTARARRDASPQDVLALSWMRASAIECIGLLAEAVKPEQFRADAEGVLEFLMRPDVLDADDAVAVAAQKACARIAGVLGPDFGPYLDVVMPIVLRDAELTPDVDYETVADGEGGGAGGAGGGGAAAEESADVSTMVLQIAGLGSSLRVSMNTTAMQKKTEACRALFEYAGSLQGSLGAWAGRMADLMLALLKFREFATIRSIAALSLPRLVRCFVAQGNGFGRPLDADSTSLFQASLLHMVQAVQQETSVEVLASLAEGIKETLDLGLTGGEERDYTHETPAVIVPPTPLRNAIAASLLQVAVKSLERREQAMRCLHDRDEVDDEAVLNLEEVLEDEVDLMTNIVDAFGYMIKGSRADFFPLFDAALKPFFLQLLRQKQVALKHNALCTLVDVVEWCGDASKRTASDLLPELRRTLLQPDAELRQVAAYGIGAIAMQHPDLIARISGALVQELDRVVSDEAAQDEENIFATENAISAIGKIALRGKLARDTDPTWVSFVKCLPLREDPVEARFTNAMLVSEVQRGNKALCNGEGLVHVARIFTSVLVGAAGGGAEEDRLAVEDTLQGIRRMLPDMVRKAGVDAILECGRDYDFAGAEEELLRSL
jgi:hypothetical protein